MNLYKSFDTLAWKIQVLFRGTYLNSKRNNLPNHATANLWRPLRFRLVGQMDHRMASALREDFRNDK